MENTTLDLLLKIAELAANIVTFCGIYFVIYQFKKVKKDDEKKEIEKLKNELEKAVDAKAHSFHSRYALYTEMDKMLVSYPELKKLIGNDKLINDIENSLISSSQLKELAFIEMVMNISQLSYFQYKNNLSSSGFNWVKELLQNKYVIQYWKSGYRCRYTSDFENFVSDRISS